MNAPNQGLFTGRPHRLLHSTVRLSYKLGWERETFWCSQCHIDHMTLYAQKSKLFLLPSPGYKTDQNVDGHPAVRTLARQRKSSLCDRCASVCSRPAGGRALCVTHAIMAPLHDSPLRPCDFLQRLRESPPAFPATYANMPPRRVRF